MDEMMMNNVAVEETEGTAIVTADEATMAATEAETNDKGGLVKGVAIGAGGLAAVAGIGVLAHKIVKTIKAKKALKDEAANTEEINVEEVAANMKANLRKKLGKTLTDEEFDCVIAAMASKKTETTENTTEAQTSGETEKTEEKTEEEKTETEETAETTQETQEEKTEEQPKPKGKGKK